MISISAFIPAIIKRLGAAPSVYLGGGLALAMLLLFPVITFVPPGFVALYHGLGIGLASW
jgi:hypothetical protein